MKIRNSTNYPDYMLRRMVGWCCQQIGMPVNSIALAVFRNSRSSWGGCARSWRKQISVCVHPSERIWPQSCSTHEPGEVFGSRVECLVAVTAHEAYHIAANLVDTHKQRTRGKGLRYQSSERTTCKEEMRVLRLFRENCVVLLTEWLQPPMTDGEKVITDKRADKAKADLLRWQRKFKLAQTKVRKLKARVAYYERK